MTISPLQVVTGESGSEEDRQREQLLRQATELRGSITRAQDRYGAVMDALQRTDAATAGPVLLQQVGPLFYSVIISRDAELPSCKDSTYVKAQPESLQESSPNVVFPGPQQGSSCVKCPFNRRLYCVITI